MRKSGYVVKVLSPTGEPTERVFTEGPEGSGIADGIAAAVHPITGCDTLEFSGRPDLLDLEGGECVQAWIRDRTGVLHPVFYGAIIPNTTTAPSAGVESYQANARTLLVGTACDGEMYKNLDTASIAYDFVSKHRHASLKVRAADFPNSGTVLPEFTAVGQLGEVLDELIAATENADYGSGVDPEGWVFFRPNSTVLEVPYVEADYAPLPNTAPSITTAVRHVYREPPLITPWSGAYVPRPFTHLSIPDAELHAKFGYIRTREIPAYAFQAIPEASYVVTVFTVPANAVALTPTTPSVNGGVNVGTFTLQNTDPLVLGVRLLYRTAEGAGTLRFRAFCGVLYDVELPNTKGELQEINIILPPHSGVFTLWNTFKLTTTNGSGDTELHSFHLLRVDTEKLDATTPVVVPERSPSQLVRDGIGSNPARIKLLNGPKGTRKVGNSGVRYVWTPTGGDQTVTDLAVSAMQNEFSSRDEFVRGYYRS